MSYTVQILVSYLFIVTEYHMDFPVLINMANNLSGLQTLLSPRPHSINNQQHSQIKQ